MLVLDSRFPQRNETEYEYLKKMYHIFSLEVVATISYRLVYELYHFFFNSTGFIIIQKDPAFSEMVALTSLLTGWFFS